MIFNFSKLVVRLKDANINVIGKKDQYFVAVTRPEVVLIKCFFGLGYSHSRLYKKFFGFVSKHKPFYDADGTIFFDKFASEFEKDQALKIHQKDPEYFHKIAEKCEKQGQRLLEFSQKIKQTDFSSFSDKQVKRELQRFFDLMTIMSAYLAFPVSMQSYFEDTLQEYLRSSATNKNAAQEYFRKLTTPSKMSTGFNEQVNILKLAIKYKKTGRVDDKLSKEIKAHLFLYDVLGVKYGIGNLWKPKDIITRIKYLAKYNPEKKLKHLKDLQRRQQKHVQEVLRIIKADKSFREFVKIVRAYIFIRTYRTDVLSAAFANAFTLFDEVGKRTGSSREDIIECLPDEVLNFDILEHKFVQKRAKTMLIYAQNSKVYYEFGQEARKIVSKLWKNINASKGVDLKHNNKKNEIKGTVANKGIAVGTVKIVLTNRDLNKVKKEDILIAVMTTPDFVPAMERAQAFVTDEGGILCHAAIISREMKKPCIIGTKNATKVLKDGDKVKIDVEKGIVEKIK